MDKNILMTIQRKLTEIEEQEDVKIIHCVESGSRAWGFESPDSDYDVRFIYVRKPEYYLKLERTRDVIEWQLDGTLDINGWDLQKALRLLHNSNPTIFEWNSSPIVYRTTQQYDQIRSVINDYFISKSGIYHYLSTAKKNYREYLRGETVKLKKYFYVLRPLLACMWIIDKGTPPPMLFSELMESELNNDLVPAVTELVRLKMNTPEIGEGKRIDVINQYIEENIRDIGNIAENMKIEHTNGWNELDRLFYDIVGIKS
ncbi:MAG: nucleotidyltransferase domain-containing protein [Oscillospiraceae bacterium]|nr:nucleotidyltransferase domain-containing protein [Oscillospiraceae bacterium]